MANLLRYDYVVQRLLQSLVYPSKGLLVRRQPVAGDLVLLTAAPQSEWHLSFYLGAEDNTELHLLESVQTGRHGRWGNVGFYVIDPNEAGVAFKMRWTDKQFEFERKFHKVFRRAGFYIDIPYIHGFDGDTALIRVRTRFGLDNENTVLEPLPYRRITQRELRAFLEVGAARHAAARGAPREQRRNDTPTQGQLTVMAVLP